MCLLLLKYHLRHKTVNNFPNISMVELHIYKKLKGKVNSQKANRLIPLEMHCTSKILINGINDVHVIMI